MYRATNSYGLWLPTDSYRHPNTGRIVDLIGMIHAADQHFYQHVRAQLDYATHAGQAITYEGVRPLSAHERAHEPSHNLATIDALTNIFATLYGALQQSGLAVQTHELPLRETWIRTDLNQGQLARSFSGYRSLIRGAEQLFSALSPDDLATAMSRETLLQQCDNDSTRSTLATWVGQAFLPTRVILNLRNKLAARGILHQAHRGHDVTSTWGAAHLPGIGELLKQAGYQHTQTEWTLAIARPNAHEPQDNCRTANHATNSSHRQPK